MRVLVTTTPGRGHYHPMLPLAHALAARGHDLLWVAHDEVCQRLQAQGFQARAAGLAEGATSVNIAERFPEMLTMPESERLGFAVSKIFGTPSAAPMLEGLLPVARRWRRFGASTGSASRTTPGPTRTSTSISIPTV